jgi:hypothetical protein
MVAAGAKKARLDARELAASRPADPYRGALTDPYTPPPAADPNARALTPGGKSAGLKNRPAALSPESLSPESLSAAAFSPAQDYPPVPPGNSTPSPAVVAGIIAIGLGAVLGLFGLLLLAIISLQDEYGAPDRSFYRGSDSSYLLLALLDFALAGCLVIGGISFLTGRLNGRLAITVAGWTVIALSGFWWFQGGVSRLMPMVIGLLAIGMLALCYQRSVTRWLGVLPAAQPE